MRVANPKHMKIMDQLAIEKYKIPALLLMENAALHIARKAMDALKEESLNKRVIVIAGKGNNGGDAFAAARHLHQWGCQVSVVSLVSRGNVTGEAGTYLEILEAMNIPLIVITCEDDLVKMRERLYDAELIIDGIFGTGFHGEVRGLFATVIRMINKVNKIVISIDIPSGVNGTTGQVGKNAIKARETVTFSLPKPGLLQFPGAGYAGKVTVVDIGIPQEAVNQLKLQGEWADADRMASYLPERPEDGHKGTFGKVLVITGSTGMSGSGTLAAKAAFKTGSGLVYLAVPQSISVVYNGTLPEAITLPLQEEDGAIGADNLDKLLELAETKETVVIGPGLSMSPRIEQWVKTFITQCSKPMVIDADALNNIAASPGVLQKTKASVTITPHPGEFSRLAGKGIEEIQRNRIEEASAFSLKYGVTVVLKGAGTVIALPDGKYFINTTGNSGLAVAGSGDVLSGIIGSLSGQGVPMEQAAVLGTYIHGRCGEELAVKNKGKSGFLAGELCDQVPSVIGAMRRKFSEKRKRGL